MKAVASAYADERRRDVYISTLLTKLSKYEPVSVSDNVIYLICKYLYITVYNVFVSINSE